MNAQGPAKLDAPVMTIDGPSGAGKGTVSHLVASRMGWNLLDSGALYRVVGLAALQRGVAFDDDDALAEMVADLTIKFVATPGGQEKIELDGQDVASKIRTEHCGNLASKVAAVSAVRAALVVAQRGFRKAPGLVADGRDMGTVIFPDAALKIFLDASPEERAERRYNQLKNKGLGVSLRGLLDSIQERDERDRGRAVSPLKPAEDAIVIDSTGVGIEAVLGLVVQHVQSRGLIPGT